MPKVLQNVELSNISDALLVYCLISESPVVAMTTYASMSTQPS